jgi:light-harvesting protein B-800-850 alpha chain
MNQGRIWCVVSPNVGLPLLLGSVAITSLIVHASVMSHTTWMSTYWQGAKARTAEVTGTQPALASATQKTEPGFMISVAPVAATSGSTQTSFVVTVGPNPAAPITTASGEPASQPVTVAAADVK